MGNPAGKNDRHRATKVCKIAPYHASIFAYGTVRIGLSGPYGWSRTHLYCQRSASRPWLAASGIAKQRPVLFRARRTCERAASQGQLALQRIHTGIMVAVMRRARSLENALTF